MLAKAYNQHKETIFNSAWRGLQVFARQGVIFFIFLISAKLLNILDFGVYNYIIAFIYLLTMIGDFGVSTATAKYVAEYNALDNKKLKLIFFNSVLIIFLVTVVVALGLIFFGQYYLGDSYKYILYVSPLIFFVPAVSLYDGIYRGLKKFRFLSSVSTIIGIPIVILSYFLIKHFGLVGSLIVQDIFYILLFIAFAFSYKEYSLKIDREVMSKIYKYSIVYGLAVLGYQLFAKIDVLILGHYGYIKEIATYEFINKFLLVLLVPFSIIGQVVAPNFSRDFALAKYNVIYKKLKLYSLFFLFLSILMGVVLYFAFPIIVKIFFANYSNALFAQIFPLSLFIFAINVSTASIDSGIVVSTGYASLMSWLYVFIGIVNIILCFILLNLFGFIGIIYATMISSIMMVLSLRILYFYKIKKLSLVNLNAAETL